MARRHVWWLLAILVLAVSGLLILWARTRPSYDAYGWLVWGWQTLHGTLDLGGAPSWKPLPFVFTLPFALFGRAQLGLWMLAAVAISLAGSVFAGRIAYRLSLGGYGEAARSELVSSAQRASALAAAAVAGLLVLGIEDYMHYILSVQSDPLLVTFTLAAIDCHLGGHKRWALAFGTLAALGRPEAWPFLGAYGCWCFLREPAMRIMVVGAAVVVLFMWFGVPWITNGRPFVSAQLAFNSPRALKSNHVFGTLGRFKELHYFPAWIAAAVAVVWAAVRRNWTVLGLAAGSAGWVTVEIAFALHGWPGLPRYMFEPAGVVAVLAGVGVGWALLGLPRLRPGFPRWVGIPLLALFAIAMLPGALHRVRTEHRDLTHERGRAKQINLLSPTIAQLGGAAHIRRCAIPTADVEWVSALAWWLSTDVGFLGYHPERARRSHHPLLVFRPLPHGGWSLIPYHLHHRDLARCQGLRGRMILRGGSGATFVRY